MSNAAQTLLEHFCDLLKVNVAQVDKFYSTFSLLWYTYKTLINGDLSRPALQKEVLIVLKYPSEMSAWNSYVCLMCFFFQEREDYI